MPNYQITLHDTNFKHASHFSNRVDAFHQYPSRDCPIILNDPAVVQQLERDGYDVRYTRPGEKDDPDTFQPVPYIYATAKFKVDGLNVREDPSIYLVDPNYTPKRTTRMTADTVELLDTLRFASVNAILNATVNQKGRPIVYIQVLYCIMRVIDPWAAEFQQPMA